MSCAPPKSDEAAKSQGPIRNFKYVFATFGVPDEMSSDGGPEFTAGDTQCFLQRWAVKHRLSSAYNPESNGRAEVGVKSMKRLLQCSSRADGALDEDSIVAGLLQYRNTPEPTTGMSPAIILFGRQLRTRASTHTLRSLQCGGTFGRPGRRPSEYGLVGRLTLCEPIHVISRTIRPSLELGYRISPALTQTSGIGRVRWLRDFHMISTLYVLTGPAGLPDATGDTCDRSSHWMTRRGMVQPRPHCIARRTPCPPRSHLP